jgi:PAS domain S-box-containing protein
VREVPRLLQSKLTKQFLTKTLIIVLLVLVSIYWLTIHVLETNVEQEVSYRDALLAKTMSKQMETLLNSMMDEIRMVTNYVSTSGQNEHAFFYAEMERIIINNPLYMFVEAFDKQGRVLTRVPEVKLDTASDLSAIQERLSWSKTRYISNLVTVNQKDTIIISYPALDENGDYVGGVAAFIKLNVLSDFLNDLKVGKEGFLLLVDREGFIIAHSDPSMIGQSLKDHPIYDNVYKERYGIWQGDLFNDEMIVAYRPLPIGGIGLLAGETVHQALAPSRQVKLLLFQGFIIILLLTVGLVLFGTSKILKPVLQLIGQARAYKEGRRKQFDLTHHNNELDELAKVMGQMAQELSDKERRLFYILESIPYCVFTTDNTGRITTFNKSAEELLLFRKEEVIGKSIIELPFKENVEEFFSWKTLRQGIEFNEVESYVFDKNKKRYDVKLYSSIFRDEDDQPIGAILVMRDVSEIKKLEEYLRQSERLAALGQLTAGVAHEIKNPLSIIQAAAEAVELELKEGNPNSTATLELISDILETTDRMNGLLLQFLALSKDSGIEVEKTTVSLKSVVGEILHMLRNKFQDHKIKVKHSTESDYPNVYGDRNQLTQVFLNIILNSIQAMESGGYLDVRIHDTESEWKVQISDTGKGIASSKLHRIFNPFFSTKRDGTGLGLSIAHEIIIQHNGKLWAESIEGQGTTLTIHLPKEVDIHNENDSIN